MAPENSRWPFKSFKNGQLYLLVFEYPRRGRQARNFTTNVPKILDLKSPSEQIFSENWRWVPLKSKSNSNFSLHVRHSIWFIMFCRPLYRYMVKFLNSYRFSNLGGVKSTTSDEFSFLFVTSGKFPSVIWLVEREGTIIAMNE